MSPKSLTSMLGTVWYRTQLAVTFCNATIWHFKNWTRQGSRRSRVAMAERGQGEAEAKPQGCLSSMVLRCQKQNMLRDDGNNLWAFVHLVPAAKISYDRNSIPPPVQRKSLPFNSHRALRCWEQPPHPPGVLLLLKGLETVVEAIN